jgi:hypothetical protein
MSRTEPNGFIGRVRAGDYTYIPTHKEVDWMRIHNIDPGFIAAPKDECRKWQLGKCKKSAAKCRWGRWNVGTHLKGWYVLPSGIPRSKGLKHADWPGLTRDLREDRLHLLGPEQFAWLHYFNLWSHNTFSNSLLPVQIRYARLEHRKLSHKSWAVCCHPYKHYHALLSSIPSGL